MNKLILFLFAFFPPSTDGFLTISNIIACIVIFIIYYLSMYGDEMRRRSDFWDVSSVSFPIQKNKKNK